MNLRDPAFLLPAACGWLARRFLVSTRRIGKALEVRMDAIVGAWAAVLLLATGLKIAGSGVVSPTVGQMLAMAFPFLLLGAAPVLGYRFAIACAVRTGDRRQPSFRLARFGRWREAGPLDRRRARIGGKAGFLVSLMVGLLLNVPVRSLKFLAIVPPIVPADPYWSQVLVATFTLQAATVNFLYMVCFVMALRSRPLFPRMLLLVWMVDLASQGLIASAMATSGLPAELVGPLIATLHENLAEVLISMALWLPYLLVSDQVNLFFRNRVRAA
uniref:DUF2569 domain-containing protein n=1 Tax=Altererythrobacter segetis TaxID=1104773 RepID=UPI0014095034|nr:DUF2569 domain-containing protein [Altererythrobacter segetis]